MPWVFGALAGLCVLAWYSHRMEWWQAAVLYVVLATSVSVLHQALPRGRR